MSACRSRAAFVAAFLVFAAGSAAQSTYYVNGSCGDNAWSGLSPVCQAPNGPKKNIVSAWALAADYDTVIVAPGTYSGPGNTKLDLHGAGKVLRSEAGAAVTIIDGQGVDNKAFDMGYAALPPPTTLEGFTLTNFTGAAVYLDEAQARIIGCRFLNNSSLWRGAAIFVTHSYLVEIVNCEFIGNSADERGGAIYTGATDAPRISNCTFVDNVAPEGGAIFSFFSEIRGCIARGPGHQVYAGYPEWATCNNVEGGLEGGEGNFDADPMFMDPETGDYRLRPDSPCIDAGDGWGLRYGYLTDLGGTPRWYDDPATPDSGRGTRPLPDVGAHEFQGSECVADCDGSGTLDLFDFLCFTNAFNNDAACPGEFLPLGAGTNHRGDVLSLTSFDEDGAGPGDAVLAAGGDFLSAGDRAGTQRIARWDGQEWSAVGGGFDYQTADHVEAMRIYDDGSGPALYAAGKFQEVAGISAKSIARWNGQTWSALAGGLAGEVEALAPFDADGGGPGKSLLVGAGSFTSPKSYRAGWDGQKWIGLGDDVLEHFTAAATFDADADGPGLPLLYGASGSPTSTVRTWDGNDWTKVAGPEAGTVSTLCATASGPDGGPALYAGGTFTNIGGMTVNCIARWDGQSWHALDSGLSAENGAHVRSIIVHDPDGGGPQKPVLYAGGEFLEAGGHPAVNVARWDGQQWAAAGVGVGDPDSGASVAAMAMYDPDADGPRPTSLHIGGVFEHAGAIATNIAYWGCSDRGRSYADCNGDGTIDLFDFLCFVNAFNQGC
jgi:predicted outer membrane repeat protein